MDQRYEIEFTEGGVGVFEILATGGLALVVEKSLDLATGDDNHGWYCTITDKITKLKDSCWGVTKGEAQEEALMALNRKITDYEVKQEDLQYWERIQKEKEFQQEKVERERKRQLARFNSTSESNNDSDFLGQILGYLIVGALVVWLIFAVALPLALVNIATITLTLGLIKRSLYKYLFPISFLGMAYIYFEYNFGNQMNGMFETMTFLSGLIPYVYYLNLLAGLLALYFLIRNILNEKKPLAENTGEFSKRNLILMGSLLLAGSLMVVIPGQFNFKNTISSQTLSTKVSSSELSNFYFGDWILKSNIKQPFTRKQLISTLNIKSENGDVIIKYVEDIDSKSPNIKIKGKLKKGNIKGDYYGHKKNVKITKIKKNEISFSIDPFAEFEPIRNHIFTRFPSVTTPIDNLFAAWTRLDLNLYMSQWDSSAAQYSKKFKPRNYQDILKRRQSLFGRLQSVQVLNYSVLNMHKEASDLATLKVKYSMVFNFTNGKKVSETDIVERYDLKFDYVKNQWLILKNYDYVD